MDDYNEQLNKWRLLAGVRITAEHGKRRQSAETEQLHEQQPTPDADKVVRGIKQVIEYLNKLAQSTNDRDLIKLYNDDKRDWSRVLQHVRDEKPDAANRAYDNMDTASREYMHDAITNKNVEKAVIRYLNINMIGEAEEQNRQDNDQQSQDTGTKDVYDTFIVTYRTSDGQTQTTTVTANNASQARRKAQQRMPDGARISGQPEKMQAEQTNEAHNYTDAYPSHEDDEDASINVVDYDDPDGTDAYTNAPEASKTEVPQQTFNRGEASSQDQDTQVKVPSSITKELKDTIDEFRAEAERLENRGGSTAKENRMFYTDTAEAFEDILGYLQLDSIEGIKQAQIYASKLMGPMLHKLPTNTWKFIQRGGPNRSLKSYMGKVDDTFPITGPRNTIDDND